MRQIRRALGATLWPNPLAKPSGSALWARSVGPLCGRALWARSLGPLSGRALWARSLGPLSGPALWARSLAQPSGRALWARSLGAWASPQRAAFRLPSPMTLSSPESHFRSCSEPPGPRPHRAGIVAFLPRRAGVLRLALDFVFAGTSVSSMLSNIGFGSHIP